MPQLAREQVEAAIATYRDPYLNTDLVDARCVKQIDVDGENGAVSIGVTLGFKAAGHEQSVTEAVREAVGALPGAGCVSVETRSRVDAHSVKEGLDLMENVRNVIAVASGKGGVGKSTVAANLALALSADGASVGMLDADIYGPSQPRMLGASGQPDSKDGKSLEPMMSYGIQSMSIGYLIDEETPMIWRGPMVTQALEQMLRDTRWRDLDYLIVDLPPGTGDTQLTLTQKIPVSAAVIVTTPQDIALLDARKGLKMFEKVQVPVLGIIENMSTHVCSKCGHEEHIFGHGGGERMASDYNVPLLGALPLDAQVRADSDAGKPTVMSDPDSAPGKAFRTLARTTAARLSLQARDLRQAFPKIQMV
ncbi:MAG: iron-sulfur cluster carrier protein ApbC [Gammaproteobacteria bacterium]